MARERAGVVMLRVRPLERRLLEEAASRTGDTLSGYVRGVALDAARRELAPTPAPPATDAAPRTR